MMDGDLERLVAQLSEAQQSQYYGKYRGLVSDNADPEGLGRIQAQVPAIFGDGVTPWAMPCVPYAGDGHGQVLLPEVGDGVWIEFEAGNLSNPIWSGCWWADGQLPDPGAEKQRLLATSAGHQLLFDEDADEIKLIHPGGAELVMTSDAITLSLGSATVEITSSEVKINDGMAKITTAGASLVNDAFKVGS